MAPTTRRARRAFAELPTDVLFDVFLLLSAKELCRLRVVCRAWRSLTCDPRFIRAHTARHQRDPLLVASFLLSNLHGCQRMLIDLIDLSGKTLKRVASAMDFGQVLCPRLGLVFVAIRFDRTCCVLDPAAADAGAPVLAPRFRLPMLAAPSHRGPGSWNRLHGGGAATSFAFGRVASTGEHKVLRIFHRFKNDKDGPQLFEVLTLAGRRRRVRAQWRDMQSPDMFVCPDSNVVVDGVACFLRNAAYKDMASAGDIIVPPADCVASFDLERGEWRKRLQGPISMGMGVYDYEPKVNLNHDRCCQFALAELKGSLVLVHYWYSTHIWILTDFETGVWVKEYSIPSNSSELPYYRRLEPLFVLHDGRLLVVRPRDGGQLAVYDPSTDDWAWVDSGPLHLGVVRVYAGSLLDLQDV